MDKKVFIRNFGCSSNITDGETLAGCIKRSGYKVVDTEAEADLIIYNTCAVKSPTENRIINIIKQTSRNKKIIISGCLPKISFDRLCRETFFDGAVGPAVGEKIVDVVKRVFAGEKVVNVKEVIEKPPLNLPKERFNPTVSIVPINYGCLGKCAYCCVVYARGQLSSYSPKEIAERIKIDYETGAKEFWITSQDTASYGRDLNTNLAELLSSIINLFGEFRVRVGMLTPNLVIDIQDQLIDAFDSNKVFKFLHLPLQSGDNSVLKGMNRFYTKKDFEDVVKAFRAKFPELTLATDVIVGFPGENGEAFQNTIELIKKVQPDIVNVSKFFARPKTTACEIKDGLVEKEEIKRRSTITAELTKKISAKKNKLWVGWTGEILVDEKGKIEGSWVGRNFAYKPIVLKSSADLLGKILQVKIIEASETYLRGSILKE